MVTITDLENDSNNVKIFGKLKKCAGECSEILKYKLVSFSFLVKNKKNDDEILKWKIISLRNRKMGNYVNKHEIYLENLVYLLI